MLKLSITYFTIVPSLWFENMIETLLEYVQEYLQ